MSICLTPEELVDITGYKRPAEQARFLAAAGIAYRLNKEKKPVVARANAERYLGCTGGAQQAEFEPDWSALQQPARA